MNYLFEINDYVQNKMSERIKKSGCLVSEKYKLARMARKDLKYNLHFVPMYKTDDSSCYKSFGTSIYIESFYVNGISVYGVPNDSGVSLSLAPGKYTFKVTYCIKDYFEVREAKHVYDPYYEMYLNKTTYSPKKNTTQTLVLEDVYIDDDNEVYLSLFVRIKAIFNEIYTRDNKLVGQRFIKYDWANGFEISSSSTISKDMNKDNIDFCLYPYHYPLNIDYSSNKGKVKENPIVNKNITYTLTYDGVTHNETYHGEMINNEKDGLGILIDKAKGITKTYFTRYSKDNFNNYGSIIYGNGFHQFGFINYFYNEELEIPYINFYKDGTVEYLYEHYEYKKDSDDSFRKKGIVFFKDNSIKLTEYEEDGNYKSFIIYPNYKICFPSNVYFEYKNIQSKILNNGNYVGELENDLPHGFGALNYNNGDRYVGHFYHGKRCGVGTYYYSNGEYIHGKFDESGHFHEQCFNYKTNGNLEYKYFEHGKLVKNYWYEKNNTNVNVSNNSAMSNSSSSFISSTSTTSSSTINNRSDFKNKSEEKVKEETKSFDVSKTYQVKYLDGSIYNGYLNTSQIPHGKGKKTFKNGDVYEGDFKNGEISGCGKYTFKNGDIYDGQFIEGLFTSGTYFYNNGEKYFGKFVNNKKEGYGTYYFKNGDRYTGNYKDDLKVGQGTYYFANGEYLVGEWKNDKKDGIYKRYNKSNAYLRDENYKDDVYDDPNALKHNITFANAKINSNDTVITYDICKYVGMVKNGVPHLVGTYYYYDGDVYSGCFNNGVRENFGTYIYRNADYYVGEFINGKYNGFGIKKEKDGWTYAGLFKEDKKHGILFVYKYRECSIYLMENGRLKSILYRDYKFNTNVKSSLPNVPMSFNYFEDDLYIGELDNNGMNGFGKLLMDGGSSYVGCFKDNYFDGLGCYYFKNGDIYIGQFEKSYFHGVGVRIYSDGTYVIGEYKKDEMIRKIY